VGRSISGERAAAASRHPHAVHLIRESVGRTHDKTARCYMKRCLGVLGVLIMSYSVSFPSMAQQSSAETFETGRTLLQKCSDEAANLNRCQSYIEGVADAMRLEQAYRRTFFGSRICINQNVLGREIKMIVVRWMREHPEALRSPAAQVIAQAVLKEFPCVR
ncbi:MAG: Rap1a/Tai family immunity protein, partial [Alphaproteobacteria bacterium]